MRLEWIYGYELGLAPSYASTISQARFAECITSEQGS